jgi:hypothetical protein
MTERNRISGPQEIWSIKKGNNLRLVWCVFKARSHADRAWKLSCKVTAYAGDTVICRVSGAFGLKSPTIIALEEAALSRAEEKAEQIMATLACGIVQPDKEDLS